MPLSPSLGFHTDQQALQAAFDCSEYQIQVCDAHSSAAQWEIHLSWSEQARKMDMYTYVHVVKAYQSVTWFPAQLGRLQKYTWN